MRRRIGVLFAAVWVCLSAMAAPDDSLELGLASFRAGDYEKASTELAAAAVPGATPETHETALIYLALAQFRLGNEDDARSSIRRLIEVERNTPVYAKLPLQIDATEFETLVTALVPEEHLPPNEQLAANETAAPLPAVRRVELPTVESDARVAQVEAEAAKRIAAIEADAQRRIAEAEQRAAAAINAQKATPAPQPARVDDDGESVRTALTDLRQAEALADNGDVIDARRIYARLASSPAREVIVAAAIGLYRLAEYRDAIDAFRRLGAFARGEEDLHFYYAVSLYEAGEVEAARKELACALPYIEPTDEVARYRTKIERNPS